MSFSPSLAAAQKAGVVVSARDYPAGEAGLRVSLEEVAKGIIIGKDDPGIRELTAKALIEAGVDGRNNPSVLQQVSALLAYVQKNTIYAPDPGKTEHIQAAHVTLCVRDMCIPMEDCFPDGTLLLRDDFEFVPVEKIEIGDRIWGRDKWTTVQKKWSKGDLPVDAITMNNGSTMFLTEGHKVYVGRCCHSKGVECSSCYDVDRRETFDRVYVRDLKEGETLLCPERIAFGTEAPDPSRAYIEGLVLADGWVRDTASRFYISGKDGHRKEAQKHEAKAILDRLGVETQWYHRYLIVKDPAWAARLQKLGERARFKGLETINLVEESAREALRGIMADSSESKSAGKKHGTLVYSTTSRKLMLQARVLHRMFGRSCNVAFYSAEQHGGAGKHPIWRMLVRKREKALTVKRIERAVRMAPCWDIQTEDHYVYLPEHDVTVSNCESLALALGAMCAVLNLNVYAVKLNYGGGAQQHLVIGVIDEQRRNLYADPSGKGPVTRVSGAEDEVWINPYEQPGTLGHTGAELVMLGKPQEREVYFKKGHWYEFAGGHWWVFADGRWVMGPGENECDRNVKATLGPKGLAVSEGTKRGMGAVARGGKWYLGDVELAPSQWSAYGLGAPPPPSRLEEGLPYQQVMDGQAHGGLRYRIGLLVSVNFDPEKGADMLKALLVRSFPDFYIETAVPNGPARQEPNGNYYQSWILQGIARVDTTVKDVTFEAGLQGDAKVLIVGVQAQSPAPVVPPAPNPVPPPTGNREEGNTGVLGPMLLAGGLAVGGGVLWHGWRAGWFKFGRKAAA